MKPRSLLLSLALLAPGAVAILGGVLSASAAAPPAPAGFQLNGDAGHGQTVFAKHCALCHGAAGDGKSKMAETLDPKPVDFTNKALVARRSDWELYLVARDGGPALGLSSKMFGWKALLPDQDLRDAVAYIRSLGR